MHDTQNLCLKLLKNKTDTFDMIQNVLEENNMEKATGELKGKSVLESVGRTRKCLSRKNPQKPHKQSTQQLKVSKIKLARLLS